MSAWNSEDVYKQLGELGIIDKITLNQCWEECGQRGVCFEDAIVAKGLISEANLGRIIADLMKVKFVHLGVTAIDLEVLKKVSFDFASVNQVIAFKEDENFLHVAMTNPEDERIKNLLKKRVGKEVISFLATKRDIEDTLVMYHQNMQEVIEKIIKESRVKGVDEKNKKDVELPVIKIVETIITFGYQNKASDIHIEPQEKKSLIRFRVDGILADMASLPKDIHEQILTRIKVLASLRTDEQKAAQDGKIVTKVNHDENELDIRVSIVPVTDGEKCVLRLLSERSRQMSLQDLGLLDSDIEKLKTAYQMPHGMILSTGPTGCGKTTTMYGILKILNTREVNIATIEDPVEYEIEGTNQIQVNSKTGLTFAKGLRSIVRQDPNIILVGEIRDAETANISVNAAMTGHLVLSTLHTNDAATCFPRLLDMKIEPFLVGSTVNVVIGQRLVRKICLNCRESLAIDLEQIKANFSAEFIKKYNLEDKKNHFYHGRGCPVCHQTGYSGRIGIFEVMFVDDKIRKAIQEKRNASEINKIAIKNGMNSMLDDGLIKVKQGLTTIQEIIRVTKEEE